MKQRTVAAGTGVLLFFLVAGGLWVGLVQLIPPGLPRSIFIVALGFFFLVSYGWQLVSRVRVILAGTPHLIRHGLIAVAEVLGMLLAFAAVYRKIGIIDSTQPNSPVVHEFWTSLYYSVVTFTTLGYGDFYPQGIGRALAGMQALTGYIVLGLLASVTANVVSPNEKAGWAKEDEEDDE